MLLKDENHFYKFIFFLLLLSFAFYFFPIGHPQPGHFFALILIFFILIKYQLTKIQAPEVLLIVFWLYTTLVNILFWSIYRDLSFIVSSIYWTFGIALFFSVRQIYLLKPSLGSMLIWCLLVIMCLQIVVFIMGEQRFFALDGRFTGFFNDPNQLSYWFLCMFVGSVLVSHKPNWFNVQSAFVVFLGLFCIVIMASSRSAMLGSVILLIGLFWWLASDLRNRSLDQNDHSSSVMEHIPKLNHTWLSAQGKLWLAFLTILLLLIGIFVLLFYFSTTVNDVIHYLVRRTLEDSIWNQLEARGYTRLIDFPQYLMFGAGQGYDLRFREPLDGVVHEVHSSFASPLFYYGVIGFVLLYSAFYLLARDRLQGWQWIVFAAPFAYGLATYGLRTPVFWIMLASLYTIPPRKNISKDLM